MYKNNFRLTYDYDLIDAYKDINTQMHNEWLDVQEDHSIKWLECPKCHKKPKLWLFDNGRYASCACHNNTYQGNSISATSVCEYGRENNWDFTNFNNDELRLNWNNYCLYFGFLHNVKQKLYNGLPEVCLWKLKIG